MDAEQLLNETRKNIKLPAGEACAEAKRRWDQIAKPLHSLGRLEDAVVQLAGIQNMPQVHLDKKALVVFCADNGVVKEGVTQTGQEVTAIVAENFRKAQTCTSIFCQDTGTDLFPIDIGMVRDVPGIRNCKIAYGTGNILTEPAMGKDQAIQALATGIQLADEMNQQGYEIVAAGEMGIGNTTTSSAVSALLTGQSVEKMTGYGAGLSSDGLRHKIQVIQKAIEKNQPDVSDPVDVIAKTGGFDIAGMAGFYLGAARYGLPVVLDGMISQTAALAAVRLCPLVREYLFASHASKEPASNYILQELNLTPFLDFGFCLGEGSGAVLFYHLLESAVHVYKKMSSFEEIQIEPYVPLK